MHPVAAATCRILPAVNLAVISRAIKILLLICTMTWAAVAYAQELPPPRIPSTDENGVGIIDFNYYSNETHLAIGPDNGRRLTFKLGSNLKFHNFWGYMILGCDEDGTHSVSTQLYANTFFFPHSPPVAGVAGRHSDTLDGAYTHSESYNSSTKIATVWLTLRDGTNIEFMGHISVCQRAIKTVIFPDGERWDFSHLIHTSAFGSIYHIPSSVITNRGYQFTFSHSSTSSSCKSLACIVPTITAINSAHEYCAPTASPCTGLTGGWPSVSETLQLVEPVDYGGNSVQNVTVNRPDGSVYSAVRQGSGPSSYLLITSPEAPDKKFWRSGSVEWSSTNTARIEIGNQFWTYEIVGRQIPGDSLTSAVKRTNYLGKSSYYGLKVFDFNLVPVYFIVWHEDELGRITRFTRDQYSRITRVELPEGDAIEYTYDNRSNIASKKMLPKPGSGLSPIIEYANYPSSCIDIKTCNKPLSLTDGNGKVTSFAYSSEHGGVTRETGPVVGGISFVKRYTYAQRYAQVRNQGNTAWVNASTPIWVLTEERYCKSGPTSGDACTNGSSDEVITSYDYGPATGGPNNLLLRGKVITSNGISVRTCYGYDRYGNKISETAPGAGLSTCP